MAKPTDRVPNTSEWTREFDSRGAAEAVQAILTGEGVDSHLEVIGAWLGVPSRFRLRVDASMAHRARWVLESSDVTERELAYLATGELDTEDD